MRTSFPISMAPSSCQFNFHTNHRLLLLGLAELGVGNNSKKKISFSLSLSPLPYRRNCGETKLSAVNGRGGGDYVSPWEEKPYGMLSGGERYYYDEHDILSFIDPPKQLIPLDPSSYNPAQYLWKKIEDIPEERRHRLLHLLKPRLISRLWEIAGTRYENPKLVKQNASSLLSDGVSEMPLELWNCRTSGGPLPIAWMNFFKKAIFRCEDGKTRGRIIIGGSLLAGLASSFSPLYFLVRQQKEVMATEQPCDVAYEFGDGLLDVEHPIGFPRPVKHPWPFNDHVVVYVRHVGPGVLVGQGWQEGKILEQLPKKLCNEILMVNITKRKQAEKASGSQPPSSIFVSTDDR